ncbi:zinc finger, CCHC-type containing protein [Tanacetum coccineum]
MASKNLMQMSTDIVKLDRFDGGSFKRWQKKIQFLLATVKVAYVLTKPYPKESEDETLAASRERLKFENDDFICRAHILNAMSDPLFDVYQNYSTAKELWNALEERYFTEDASSKKFIISKFNSYKMVDSRPIKDQMYELEHILNVKKNLKHRKDDLSLKYIGKHLLIEEQYRLENKTNDDTSKVHVVEEKGVSSKASGKKVLLKIPKLGSSSFITLRVVLIIVQDVASLFLGDSRYIYLSKMADSTCIYLLNTADSRKQSIKPDVITGRLESIAAEVSWNIQCAVRQLRFKVGKKLHKKGKGYRPFPFHHVMEIGLECEHLKLYDSNASGFVNWTSVLDPPKNQPLTWYKAIMDAPPGDEPVAFDMSHMGKGGKFNSGKCNKGCGEPAQRWYYVSRSWFKPSGNVLVLFEEKGRDPIQITFSRCAGAAFNCKHMKVQISTSQQKGR